MTPTEAHAIAEAVVDRRDELVRWMHLYETDPVMSGWTDLAAEHRAELDILERLLLFANVAEMQPTVAPETESEIAYANGNR